jgi:photosystem II stability/assembly factor-like uncharacterized protein
MTTDDEKASAPPANAGTPAVAQPWYSKHRTVLVVVGGIVAAIVLLAVLIANTPAATWGAPSQNIGHPLALLTDPSHPSTIYAGTEQGKVYTSDDGASWTDISAGLPPNAPVSALAKSNDGAHLLAGTSSGVFAYSTTARMWSDMSSGLPQGDGIDALAFAATNDENILAGTEQHGMFRSTDGGKTWSATSGLPANADVYGVTVLPDFQTVYAALMAAGVYQSTDDGATWAATSTGLPANVNVFSVITSTPFKGATALFAGTSQGVFRSEDGAKTWVASSNGIGTTRVISLAADTREAGFIVAGTDAGVFQTLDDGATWHGVARGLPTDAHKNIFIGVVALTAPSNGNVYYFAAADAIYRYPGFTTPFISYLERGLILILLIGVVLWVGRRQQRITRALTPPPTGTLRQAGTAGTGRAPVARTAGRPSATRHIRGGPAPSPSANEERKTDGTR